MISKELMNSLQLVAKNHQVIFDEISAIYKRFQKLKINSFGYSWAGKCISIFDVIEMDYDSRLIYINRKRGCAFAFPIRWLCDSNWETEAIEGIKIERDYALIEKLES